MNPETVVLTDASAGSSAKVLVGFGFNCYSFSARAGGETVETLWSAPGFETGKERPSHSGIPLLFPYPGRLRGKTLEWQGRSYPLDGDDGRGNAIHGFVLNRPWKVHERSATRVVGEFHASQVEPEILKKWPADFRLTVSYELRGNTLASVIEIANPDNKPLPFGLGTHPYFRVPLGAAGTAGDCVVTVPAKEIWELSDMVPTGKRLPAEGRYNLAAGMKFADAKFDDIPRSEHGQVKTIGGGPNKLPSANVSAIGRVLFSDHLLAIELAGTLLLVATAGAIAIAGRREKPTT